MGLSAAAFMAGLKPNMTPTMIENNVEPTIDINEILVAQPAKKDNNNAMLTPTTTPISPPLNVMITDSIKNCAVMSALRAPIALRNPISLVRSVTETNIIFITPIPPTNKEIAAFCQRNYGVTFPMMGKISVKGNDMNEVYQFLTKKAKNGVKDSEVEWNFQKYLLNAKGELVQVYLSGVEPSDPRIVNWIKG